MRLRWVALVVAAVAGPLTGAALAAGSEVTGMGFRARVPAEFRAGGSEDKSGSSSRSFHRDVLGAGELVLTFASHVQDDLELAKTEMGLSRGLDAVAARAEVPDSEPRVTDARVPGAHEAYEVLAVGEGASQRILSARAGGLRVTVTLTAPAGADEQAEDAWQLVTASLRVEEPAIQVGTIVLWVLGLLIVLAVMVKVSRRGPPQRLGARPPAPPPAARPERFEPAPPPVLSAGAVAPARARGAGFSRADDGLPVFTPEAKAAGMNPEEALRLPGGARSAPTPPRLPPPASTPPNLKPAPPAVRIIKGYQ